MNGFTYIPPVPEDRITRAIRLARDCIAAHNEYYPKFREAQATGLKYPETLSAYAPVYESVGLLFKTLDTDFPEMPTVAEAKSLFETPPAEIDYLDESNLREIVEAAVPIAMARELIQKHRLVLDANITPGFQEFAVRYYGVLVA